MTRKDDDVKETGICTWPSCGCTARGQCRPLSHPDARTPAEQMREAAALAVKVKPLVWFDAPNICTREKAEALGGHYSIVEFDAGTDEAHYSVNIDLGGLAIVFVLEMDPLGGRRPKQFKSLEDARDAAQADYESRILAAIEPPAPTLAEVLADFARDQRPLDADMSAAVLANVEALYEPDCVPDEPAQPITLADALAVPEIAALVALLNEARADLRSYIENAYPSDLRDKYADMHRQYDRDMDLCRRIDAALAKTEGRG